MRQRMAGLVMLAGGAVIAYFSVYSPLMEAERGEEKVSLSMKGAILCPIAIVVGAIYAALGERAKAVFGTRDDPSWLAWVICISLVIAGVILYLWLRLELERQGYQF